MIPNPVAIEFSVKVKGNREHIGKEGSAFADGEKLFPIPLFYFLLILSIIDDICQGAGERKL